MALGMSSFLTPVAIPNLSTLHDQIVEVLAVKLADLAGIHRGRDGNIAGAAQHPARAEGHWLSDRRRSGLCCEECQMNLSC